MNEQRLFEIASQTKLKGHDEKHCTFPTQNIHPSDYFERKIRESCSPYIYNYVMLKVICQQLFNRLVTSTLIYRIVNNAANK